MEDIVSDERCVRFIRSCNIPCPPELVQVREHAKLRGWCHEGVEGGVGGAAPVRSLRWSCQPPGVRFPRRLFTLTATLCQLLAAACRPLPLASTYLAFRPSLIRLPSLQRADEGLLGVFDTLRQRNSYICFGCSKSTTEPMPKHVGRELKNLARPVAVKVKSRRGKRTPGG